MAINAVIFDLWGTLVENGDRSPMKQSYDTVRLRMSFGEFASRFEKATMTKQFKTQSECFAAMCDEFKIPQNKELIDALIGIWNKNKLLAKPYPESEETLKELKSKGIKLAIISNTFKPSIEGILEKFGFEKYFDIIDYSCDTGMLKTEKGAFEHIIKNLKVTKDEAIMVGDSTETDIVGARNAGIKGILIDRRDKRQFEPKILNLKDVMKFL